jgi:hypothetical protein
VLELLLRGRRHGGKTAGGRGGLTPGCGLVTRYCQLVTGRCATVEGLCAPVKDLCAPASRHCAMVRGLCAAARRHCTPVSRRCATGSSCCAPVRSCCAAVRRHCAAVRGYCATFRRDIRRWPSEFRDGREIPSPDVALTSGLFNISEDGLTPLDARNGLRPRNAKVGAGAKTGRRVPRASCIPACRRRWAGTAGYGAHSSPPALSGPGR